MSWQTIEPNQHASLEPRLHVYADGDSYINAAADQQWFSDYDAVEIKVDPDGGRLGLVPRPESSDSNYALVRDGESGADISSKRAFRRLGFEAGSLDSSETIPLQYDDGVIIADVSELLPGETKPHHEIGTDGTATTETDMKGNGHAVTGPSPTESNTTTNTNLTPTGSDSTATQTSDYETPDLDNETRQDVLEYVLGVTAGGRTVLLESREIADELDMRGQTVAQHLRLLRDGDLDLPADISLEEDEDWPRQKWRLDGHETGGQTPDSDGSATSTSDDLEVVQEHIDNGVNDVHDLAAKTGLACDRIRSLTREADLYGDLTDAPEDGGYGRA